MPRGYSESITKNFEGIWGWGRDLIRSTARGSEDAVPRCATGSSAQLQTLRIFLTWVPHSMACCKSATVMLNRSPTSHSLSNSSQAFNYEQHPEAIFTNLLHNQPLLRCAAPLAEFDCKTHRTTSKKFSVHTNENLESSR